jgi:hypothetical protein
MRTYIKKSTKKKKYQSLVPSQPNIKDWNQRNKKKI